MICHIIFVTYLFFSVLRNVILEFPDRLYESDKNLCVSISTGPLVQQSVIIVLCIHVFGIEFIITEALSQRQRFISLNTVGLIHRTTHSQMLFTKMSPADGGIYNDEDFIERCKRR